MKQDGIDFASTSLVPWCLCGWRDLAFNREAATELLQNHRRDVHDIYTYNAQNIRWDQRHGGMK